MKYRFGPASLPGGLSLVMEGRSIPADAPIALPAAEILAFVRSGRIGFAVPSGKGTDRCECRKGDFLVLSGRAGWKGHSAQAGREGAEILCFDFDRDPFLSISSPFSSASFPGILPAAARSPWRSAFMVVRPPPPGGGLAEAVTAILERALILASGSAEPDTERVLVEEERICGPRELGEFVAAGALAQLVAILAVSPVPSLKEESWREPRERPWKIVDAVAWIDSHYEESFSLEEMVARCAMNTSDFSRSFKAATGSPLFEYLNRRRIARAAMLLKDGDLSVTEIAFSVGYNNLTFFNRYFLRLMGLTPTAFRRQNR